MGTVARGAVPARGAVSARGLVLRCLAWLPGGVRGRARGARSATLVTANPSERIRLVTSPAHPRTLCYATGRMLSDHRATRERGRVKSPGCAVTATGHRPVRHLVMPVAGWLLWQAVAVGPGSSPVPLRAPGGRSLCAQLRAAVSCAIITEVGGW